ncbi:MAG TPA: ribonuclease J, partial [Armatimonadota bacterium]
MTEGALLPQLKTNPDALRIIPLGGIGEIGKNMYAYEFGGKIIVVDCGLMFPEQEMLGIDIVIPDITYLLEHAQDVLGILLTHGHEDHVGALPWVLNELNVPVWGTRLTLGLVRNKLSEHTYLAPVTLHEIDPDQSLELGPFRVNFFRVTHSIRDGVGFIIDTPAARVVHTGDFKFNQSPLSGPRTEVHKLAQAAIDGVTALMSDTTNAERPGWVPSEREVADTLDELFANAPGRVIVATFASNISRMQEILNVSALYERRVCVIGRSMRANMEIARDLGYIRLPYPDIIIEPDQVSTFPPNEVTVLTTGSQGEPLSALRLMSNGEHKYIKLSEGDLVVISATPIPGNEDLVYRTINQLFRQGADVVYYGQVHVSGHGNEEELKMMLTLTSPQFVIPMHGEYRHLIRYRKIAAAMGYPADRVFILQLGDVLELTRESAKVIGQVPAGRVMIDGLGVGDIGTVVLRDRKHLSEDGMLVAIVGIDSQTGAIVSGPDIITRGFVYAKEAEDLIEDAKEVVRAKVQELSLASSADLESAKTAVRSALNRFVHERTKRRPMVIPVIM